jgi:hypothetical protein
MDASGRNNKEPKQVRLGTAVLFGIILLLALTAAACWYYLVGSKGKRAPGTPQASSYGVAGSILS